MTHPLHGKAVFVRTPTMYYTGMVSTITDDEIVLTRAAWIPSTGRWHVMLIKGVSDLAEIEPYPDDLEVYLRRDMIVEWFEWVHELPRDAK